MTARLIVLAVVTAALAAAGALAEPPAPPPERRICRGGERQLGSHMRSPRRCRTAEEWRERDEADRRLPPSLQVTSGQNDGVQPRTPQ